MNRSILGKVFSSLFVFYLLGYGAFLIYCLATFSASQVLPIFQRQYAGTRAFVLFMEYLIPIHVSGIVVALSLGSRARANAASGDTARPFGKIASSTLVAFVVLTVVYTVFFEGLAPSARARLSGMEYQSRLAREFLSQANARKQKGDFSSALTYADYYLRIDRENPSVTDLRAELAAEAAKQQLKSEAKPAPAEQPPQGLDAAALLEKSRYYFEKQDYYSAHYYATQALGQEPGRTDAMRLAAQAWDKITGFTPSQAEADTAKLYEQKKRAYDALMGEDVLTAYYSFVALAEKYPKDADVAEYLEKSRQKVQEASFFIDEAQKAVPLPGTENVVFINKEEKGTTEAVFIGKLVETGEGVFALDVEAIQYRSDGSVVYHFSVPYGKLFGSTLVLHAIDGKDRLTQVLPLYLAGSRPKAEQGILILRPTVEEMRALSADRGGSFHVGLARLWRMKNSLAGYGLLEQGISVQLVMDILMPFVFLTLSFFALAFGWGFRARYLGSPPPLLYVFVPFVPLVASLISLLWIYGHRVLLGFAVLAFGFAAALAVCAVLELVVLVISLILLAGQTSG